MPLYDRPVWSLMLDAIADLPETFSTSQMVTWFAQRYPLIQPSTIRLHLRSACVNVPQDPHHPDWQARELGSKLFKLDRSNYTRYRSEMHGIWENGNQSALSDELELDDSLERGGELEDTLSFALELHLEDFLEANWQRIDFGRPLDVWKEDGRSGRQYVTDVGVVDFLCIDKRSGDIVVVELKKGRSSDRVVGQCLRYMGWVSEHLAKPGQKVSGIIVSPESDERLNYALKIVPSIEMLCYRVQFQLVKPNEAVHD